MFRICIDCKEEKLLSEFPKNGNSYRTRCKLCNRIYNTINKRETYRADRNRELMLLKRFKLSLEDYNQMLEDQNYACAVCKKPETATTGKSDNIRMLAVDHDHDCCPGNVTCGKCIRGLLCYRCNSLLGYSRDKIEVLESAISYLKEYSQ